MTTPRSIYEKFTIGEHLTNAELEEGFNHFNQLANLLNISGPVFHLASVEANRVAGEFNIFLDNRKHDIKVSDDAYLHASRSYQDGYATGLAWKYDYQPGGPFHYAPRVGDNNPEHIRRANNTLVAHSQWMTGFSEGLAAKKATDSKC